MKYAALLACALLVGCSSATKEIHNRSAAVAATARQAAVAQTTIVETATPLQDHADAFVSESADIIVEQASLTLKNLGEIEDNATAVQTLTTRVKDKTPWWAQIFGNILWILLIGGIIFLLFYTGAWRLLRIEFYWFAALLPNPRTQAEVRMDMDTLNGDRNHRESVAAKRVNPRYNAIWKREKARARRS